MQHAAYAWMNKTNTPEQWQAYNRSRLEELPAKNNKQHPLNTARYVTSMCLAAYLGRKAVASKGDLAVSGRAHRRTKSDSLLSTLKLEVCAVIAITLQQCGSA